MRVRLWEHQSCADADACALAEALHVPPVIGRLLLQRGLADPEAAARFLEPRVEHLHDPYKLTDLGRAVERLERAIAQGESIAIHGDYDVDGITSTVILRRAIELLGGRVTHFIPERLRDGYGLSPANVERLHADGTRLVVSVDCGIRSGGAARRARELGIDLVITDHHEPEDVLPDAFAVLNPKRRDCSYPDKHLAGVGVALKLVQALCARAGREKWLPGFIKVAALGTLADVVPLVGENRVIARLGLERLSAGPHTVGLQALLEVAGLLGKTIDSYHVAFLLAPRVNAAGRMSSPDIAARLLLAADPRLAAEARGLAELLNVENTRRQEEEAGIVVQARKVIETDPGVGAHNVLVVAGDGWHRGVIGIVASKLVDAFHKPAIVLSIDGDTAHGSCRSIPAFDMLASLERCADLFDRFGGHKQAAGLTMPADRVAEFRRRINAWANETLEPDDLRPRLTIDAPMAFGALSPDVVEGLDRLAPFGAGNPKPVFESRRVTIVNGPTPMKERHLSMTLKHDGRTFRALAWRAVERRDMFDANRDAIDVAYCIEKNVFRGESSIELSLADARAPQDTAAPAER